MEHDLDQKTGCKRTGKHKSEKQSLVSPDFFEVSLHNIEKWVNYKKMTLIRP